MDTSLKMSSSPPYDPIDPFAPSTVPAITLTHRFTRSASRSEIHKVSLHPCSSSTAAFAVYATSPTQSWIDVFDTVTRKSYTKFPGPDAAFCPAAATAATEGRPNRIATLRHWTAQVGHGVEYHYASSLAVRDFVTGKTALDVKAPLHDGPIAWTSNGKAFAACEPRSRVGVWSASTGARLGQILSHIDTVTHIAFTPDTSSSSSSLVTLSRDGTLRISDPTTGRTTSRLELPSHNPSALRIDPYTGDVLSLWDATLHVWNPHANILSTLDLRTARTTEGWLLALSPDARYLCFRTEDGFDIMRRHAGPSGTAALAVVYAQRGGAGPQHVVTAADFSADGRVLLLGRMNGDVEVWDIHSQG